MNFAPDADDEFHGIVAHLQRDLADALEQQRATAEILDAISASSIDLSTILQKLLATASRLCRAGPAQIFRFQDGIFRSAASQILNPVYEQIEKQAAIIPGLGTLVGRVGVELTVVQIADAWTDPLYEPKEEARIGNVRTMLGVPLIARGELIGAFALARSDVEPFSDREVALVTSFANQAVIAIENARLFEQLQTRTREMHEALERQTAISDVLNVISQSPAGIQPVLDCIVNTARRICDAYDAAILLREGIHLRVAAHRGPILIDFQRLPLTRGWVAGRAVIECRAIHVLDLTLMPDEYPEGYELACRMGHHTILAVPLVRDGVAAGAIALRRTEIHAFSEQQVAILQTFADQAVIAIDNVRLFEEVQARTRDVQEALEYQTATGNVLGVISRSPDTLRPVLDAIVRIATELCDGFDATILLRDGEMLRVGAHHGEIPLDFDAKAVSPGWITGRAVIEGVPVHVHDFRERQSDFPEGYELSLRQGHRTGLAIPLLRDGIAIGAFMIRRLTVAPFSEKQIQVLQTFADQAVIAINNVHLFEEVQARTEELREALQQQTATADVLKTISRSTFDLRNVLHTLVGAAARLCEAEKGMITREIDGVFYRAEFHGFTEEFMDYVRKVPVEPGHTTAAGRVLLEGRIVHIPDLDADPEYWRDARQLGQYRTILGVPMLREDVVVGVLTLMRSDPKPFTERQIELVSTFADQAAIAIENVRLFEQVQSRTQELAESLEELRAAQDRLVQTQKLAALGQLTAGVAHEIKNPLNFVNNFADLSAELIDEQKAVLASGHPDAISDANELATTIKGNLEKIVQHGRRADSIVKNMLLHSREGSGERRELEVNRVAEESLNLAYHGARAENLSFNVRLSTALDPNAGTLEGYPQELARVLLNLISNAFHAVHKRQSESGHATYEPTVTVSSRSLTDSVEIRVRDNGTGIPDEVRVKMFDPFFTTKPPGEGTGLGLSLSHDIVVKQHGGRIDVETKVGEFTEFVITLPRRAS